MCCPFGENATHPTQLMCLVNGPATTSPVAASHTQIVRSADADAMRFPSGENATDKTASVCPVNGPATISPVVASHTRIVKSRKADAIRCPSGENTAEWTVSCASIVISNAGQSNNCPRLNNNLWGNRRRWCSTMREEDGAKGRADIYMCGTLLDIAIPKYRTKANASFTNANISSTSDWGDFCNCTQ
jgi:hypothetical protein